MKEWRTIKCLCKRTVLAEVRGDSGEVRRHCRRCGGVFVIDVATGYVREFVGIVESYVASWTTSR